MLPVLFTLPTPWGAQPVYSYGVMLGLSLIVGFQILERSGKREGHGALYGNAALIVAAVGMLGARLMYVLENRESFEVEGAPAWFDITSGGVAAYGGFSGGLLAAALYLRNKPVKLAVFGDAAAPAIAAGTVLTRLGCYLYGCDFGTPLSESAPGWLQRLGTFPRWSMDALQIQGSPAFLHHQRVFGLARDAAAALPVHPTQLYEAVCGALLLGLSLWLAPRKRFAGEVILAVAFAYAIARFAIEYVRDDPDGVELYAFSSAQLGSIAMAVGSAIAYSVLRSNARRVG